MTPNEKQYDQYLSHLAHFKQWYPDKNASLLATLLVDSEGWGNVGYESERPSTTRAHDDFVRYLKRYLKKLRPPKAPEKNSSPAKKSRQDRRIRKNLREHDSQLKELKQAYELVLANAEQASIVAECFEEFSRPARHRGSIVIAIALELVPKNTKYEMHDKLRGALSGLEPRPIFGGGTGKAVEVAAKRGREYLNGRGQDAGEYGCLPGQRNFQGGDRELGILPTLLKVADHASRIRDLEALFSKRNAKSA